MTTRQISRRKREEDDQDDEDIQFQYVSSHLSLMHSTNPLYSEEDRKRIMVDSDEEPVTPSNSRDPNAMDDS